jgi:hypothetical protein
MKKLEVVVVATETPRGEVRTPLAPMLPRVMGLGIALAANRWENGTETA